jgi:hypothetical protein
VLQLQPPVSQRAFGPTVSGFLFSTGLRLGYSGWCSAVIALAGAIISPSMTDKGGGMDVDEKSDEDQELGFEDHIFDHCTLASAIAAAAEQRDDQMDEPVSK